jgi:signal transduction histidine kinase
MTTDAEAHTMNKPRPTILVVDDSPEDRAVYRQYLQDAYDIHEAERGTEILTLCQSLQPACLLLDYRLPDVDGLELLRRVRAQYETHALPVLLLTGRGSETIAVEAMKQGAQDYLVKDALRPEALQRIILNTIEIARLQRAHLQAQVEQRRLEQELLRAQKIESVGVLAGGIAHDFNNLLTGILGNISLAKLFAEKDERIITRLTEAEKACQRATTLTQQLLTFSKGGAPVRQTVSIAELLRESTVFALRGSNVRADLMIAEDLWPIDADAGQINQVIHNVVLNAAQAMPDGGAIQVRAENMVLHAGAPLPLPAGRYLKIAMIDRGCGIPADILPKIFDPYFTTKAHGSGLGLASAYAIITKHDGYITAASEVSVGTTFSIYLPAAQHPVPPVQEGPVTPSRGVGRILVMDDEEIVRELLSELLTILGYTVVCTRDGAEAIAAYQRAQATGHRFTAVILDITVPGGLGGKETIAQLRTIDPQVNALVSSGYTQDPILANFAQYGFRGMVPKPYTVEQLQHALQCVIQGRSG